MSDESSSHEKTRPWLTQVLNFPEVPSQYEIHSFIGAGGMGKVFLGTHIPLNRRVAIKILQLDRLGLNIPQAKERFNREMLAIGKLDHPNVVKAYDGGEQSGNVFLVMEYLEGVDLSQLVRQSGTLPIADACEIIRQAAVGLGAIHESDMVHRDIKPSNIMLATMPGSDRAIVKILDLGVAKLVSAKDWQATPNDCIVGTVDYLAPEQANPKFGDVGPASDLYSLGCSLFQLLTGHVPFPDASFDSLTSKLYAHCHNSIHEIPEASSLPPGLLTILATMTNKFPDQRYSSAEQVATALEPFAIGSRLKEVLSDWKTRSSNLHGDTSLMHDFSRRQTRPVEETPLETRLLLPAPKPLPRRRYLVAGTLVGIVFISFVSILSLGMGPVERVASDPTDSVPSQAFNSIRQLDREQIDTYHPLLDRMPFCPDGYNPDQWNYNPNKQVIELTTNHPLLIHLGCSNRKYFNIEAGIEQMPWSGGVGFFWAYREDTALKHAHLPNTTYAWANSLVIRKLEETPPRQGKEFTVGIGSIMWRYNKFGNFYPHYNHDNRQDIPEPTEGEKILDLRIFQDKLLRAYFCNIELTNIYKDQVPHPGPPTAGNDSFGIITHGNHAWYRNVRYFGSSAR